MTKMWSPPIPESLNMDCVEMAVDMTIDLLSPYLGQAKVLEMSEIKVPLHTSPGILGSYLGYRDKVQALEDSYHLVDEFMEYGPKDNIIPIFSEVQKVDELLPIEKILIGKVRSFIIPDYVVWAAVTRLFYDMDTYLKQSPYIAVGYSKFSAGYVDLLRYLSQGSLFSYEDCTNYDRSLWILFAYVIICVRMEGYAPQFEKWVEYVPYFTFLSFMNVRRLPTGVLISKEDGVSSGDPRTSTDGCISHIFLDCYTWLRCGFDSVLYSRHVFPMFYSDDVVRSCTNTTYGKGFLSKLREYYAELGVTVKPFEILTSILGVEFLGCRFEYVEGRVVPVFFETEKVLDALNQPKGKYDLDTEFGRALSLYYECYWNLKIRDVIQSYLRFLKRKGANGKIPTSQEVRGLWFGYE